MHVEPKDIEAVRDFARSDASVAKTIASEMAASLSRMLDIRNIDTSGGDYAVRLLAHKAAYEELNALFSKLGFDVTSLEAAKPAVQRRSERRAPTLDTYV